MKICSIESCNSKAIGRGWCHKHYKRWQTNGDPEKITNKRIHGMTVKERILDTVKNVNGCWIWIGSVSKRTGRPRLKVSCKTTAAHRASYEAFVGKIPPMKMVCHTCDNPLCVNPDHLFVGTGSENMKDCKNKGRNYHGDRHHRAKLRSTDIDMIVDSDLPVAALALKFNVALSTIYRAKSGKSWGAQNANRRQGNI